MAGEHCFYWFNKANREYCLLPVQGFVRIIRFDHPMRQAEAPNLFAKLGGQSREGGESIVGHPRIHRAERGAVCICCVKLTKVFAGNRRVFKCQRELTACKWAGEMYTPVLQDESWHFPRNCEPACPRDVSEA